MGSATGIVAMGGFSITSAVLKSNQSIHAKERKKETAKETAKEERKGKERKGKETRGGGMREKRREVVLVTDR